MLDLTPSETKIVLLDVLAALSDPEALEQARSVAGNDMLRQMQTVFPLSVQIEAHVLAQHGLVGRPSSTFDDGPCHTRRGGCPVSPTASASSTTRSGN